MLLPLIGAGLGGYSAYQQSGGDLGATLLGTGLGAVTPAGLRMAGTALGGTALGAKALAAGSRALGPLQGAAIKAGLGPIAPIPALTAAGLGAGAAGIGTLALGAPAYVGKLASSVASPARSVASGGARLMSRGQAPSGYPEGPAVPQMDQFGNVRMYGSDAVGILSPAGPFQAQLLAQDQQALQTLRQNQLFGDYEARMAEGSKKADLQRLMAAAGVRQNIATQAALLQGGAAAARQMGQTSLENIGRGLTQVYQYQ
jgi:hypothetical protein